MTAAGLLLVAVLGVAPPSSDTVVELRRGDRVVIENLSGEISVGTWDRDRLELRIEDDENALVVERSGSRVAVVRDDRKGRRNALEVSIRVPEWVDLEVRGRSLDVTARGLAGRISVSNVSGDVWIEDGRGEVEISTVAGEIDVVNVRGNVSASSQAEDVRLERIVGRVVVHSGSGDVTLKDIEAESVRAETQDGDIEFSGTVADGGSYGFFVHDGDVTVAVQREVGARVMVSTFDGEFQSEFPVVVQRFTGGREFEFTLGDGSARIEIQVFDGEIRLLRRR